MNLEEKKHLNFKETFVDEAE